MIYLTAQEIEVIHYTLMELYNDSEQAGIKFQDKFESLLERPKTELYGQEQFPTVLEKACCYFHSIVKGHIFHNGNKRTALTVFMALLDVNGYESTMTEEEAEEFTVYVAEDDKFRGNNSIKHLVTELKDFVQPK